MRILTIRDFCYISDGNYSSKYPRSDEFVSVGIPFIRANNLVNGTVVPDDMYYISPDKHAELRKGHLQEGDVLITTRGNIGQTAIVPEKFHDANINAQIVLLRVDRNIAIPQYLAYALHSESVEDQIRRSTTGTALKQLPVGKLENIKVKIHPYSEQQRIVTVMHQVDELIYARRKQLAKLEQLVKSRFVELFGMPGTDTNGWGLIPLGEVCQINPKKGQDKRLASGLTVSFVPMPAVSEKGEIDPSDTREYDAVKTGFTYFAENDVLFAKITPCMENGKGAVARGLYNGIGFGSTEFHVLRPINGKTNPYWIYMLTAFSQFREDAANNMTGSAGQRRVPASFLESYRVSVPPIELQEQFAAFVKQTDKSKLAIQQSLDKLELLKKSLMQEYFG